MNLDLARWQFAIITVYHFLFVPLTIGLSLLVAGMQTAWVRTSDDRYLRMTKFWGKLFLINFAMGVITGIVQEFQFGMNWSEYSRFVGDIFGAPLATEVMRPSLRMALVTVLIAGIGVVITGDLQARLMTEQQPMKMAAAEALYDTAAPASFSVFTVGSLDGSKEIWSIRLPGVLSFMA